MLNKIVLRDNENSAWLVFEKPLEVFTASHAAEVRPVLLEAERGVNGDGLFAAGFIGYEAASGLDPALQTRSGGDIPLVCLGLFEKPQRRDDLQPYSNGEPAPADWAMNESEQVYSAKLARIKRYIEQGITYQINYTVRQHSGSIAHPWDLFLQIATDVRYAAYIDCQEFTIVSASPELFFQLDGERLYCKPMKGTAPRGMTAAADTALRDELHRSTKNRAENVMIADMIRNDLGRVAKPGSVTTESLYDVEKLKTVWQMTSAVTATTSASVTEIFEALFPCASVTGAPKVSSMSIIAELEDTPRGVYTGAIGRIAPDRQAEFSVAIRTAVFDKRTGSTGYGVGGGIVWDSESGEEYAECLCKARILSAPQTATRNFQLLETMLWEPGKGFFLLDGHLRRLRSSAEYFDYKFDAARIEAALLKRSEPYSQQPHRIRLLLRRDGDFEVSESVIMDSSQQNPVRIALSQKPIDKGNPFLYHKTTERGVYEQARTGAGDIDDVLLWNENGEITETTIGNVAVRIDGELCTPPIECGLLGGTYREYLLQTGRIKERVISVAEVLAADEIMLVNSVRRGYAARLIERRELSKAR